MRYLCLVMVLMVGIVNLRAQEEVNLKVHEIVKAGSVQMHRSTDSVRVTMPINLEELKVDRKEILLIRVVLTSREDSLELPSVGIYGREPYYYFIRSGRNQMQSEGDIKIRDKDKPRQLAYCQTIAYQPWMDRATAQVIIGTTRMCVGITHEATTTGYQATPQVVRREPVIEVSKGTVEGRAYVDFVLDSINIRPDYHNNAFELAKIDNAIDSLLKDTTTHITHINIKGWASPEGPYDHNVYLARERSRALRTYVIGKHQLDTTLVSNTFEPEDWPGLRQYVEQSNLPHRREILDIIDGDLAPDPKLRLIRQTYKQDFADIFENSLPYLRHSDYRIDYEYKRVRKTHEADTDTLWTMPTADHFEPCGMTTLRPFKPVWALKTNLLFDAATCFNFEIEVPFGRNKEWSIMVEDWFPWYVWHHNSRAFELWALGIEGRRWLNRKGCIERPLLTGTFVGAYAAGGKYDIEWNSNGDQGEFFSFGGTFGHSWVLNRRWNFELSASVGVVVGPRRHYHGEFDDEHLIWKRNANLFYVGPTKLKASLVWLIENPFRKRATRKGTARTTTDNKALFNILKDQGKGGSR